MNRHEEWLFGALQVGSPGRRHPAWRRTRYEFILEYGWWYEPAELPGYLEMGPEGECFSNSFGLALDDDRLIYVEGLVAGRRGGIPVHHAWLTDGTGRAIDCTLREPGAAYAGVPFGTSFLNLYCLEHEGVICMLDDWQHDWPMLCELGDRPEEWLEEQGKGMLNLT